MKVLMFSYSNVSSLARINFLFSSSYGLSFRFLTKSLLITSQCYSFCWQYSLQGLVGFSLCPGSEETGCNRVAGDTVGRWPREIFHKTVLHSAIKGRRGGFRGISHLSLRHWVSIRLPMGGGEWFLFHHLFFFFFSLLPLILHLLDNFVSVFVCLFYLELLLISLFSSLSYRGWRKTWVSGYLIPTCPPGFTCNESWFLKI